MPSSSLCTVLSCSFRLEFLSDKSKLGSGKKRNILFQSGPSAQETIASAGFLNSDLIVKVAPGLPNTSSKFFTHRYHNRIAKIISGDVTLEKCQQISSLSSAVQGLYLQSQNARTSSKFRLRVNFLYIHPVSHQWGSIKVGNPER
jgi:hypothetical protein